MKKVMNDQTRQLSVGITVLFEIILIVTAFVSIATKQWNNLFLTLLTIVCLILPFIITRIANIKNLVLPSSFQLITSILVFLAQYLGEIMKFYLVFWWWDLLLHAIFGSFAVIIASSLIKGSIRKEQETTEQRFTLFIIIFSFNFSIALGTLWEMFEFLGDYLVKTNMVKGGLEDTSTDLLITSLAAFITSLICYFRSLKSHYL
ncbi:hypothetical protein [Desulfosporosinus sp. OT]|uniref:hypothetical protein n=1 Tax=Desulfosporosinus sp. OT TaxID=913865 RepID=UPI000223B06E|nr:hypothetical protein [Desulfosporosinus sp. OT]EGW39583.1 putative membrane protein [Desulfosporosinus sp. OT]